MKRDVSHIWSCRGSVANFAQSVLEGEWRPIGRLSILESCRGPSHRQVDDAVAVMIAGWGEIADAPIAWVIFQMKKSRLTSQSGTWECGSKAQTRRSPDRTRGARQSRTAWDKTLCAPAWD